MYEELNQKLDELIKMLEEEENIKKIQDLKKQITDKELNLIKNYRDNPTIENKKRLYDNNIIGNYLVCENNINFLIIAMNKLFKRGHRCEGYKW